MGNILTINQPNPSPIKNYIRKGEYPGSKYYRNNYLREWVAEHRIDVNYHKWLPLGVNYSTLYKTTNDGIVCEVYHVRSYFSKTQLTLQNHLSNVQILNDNCYILLSQKQQELLNLEDKPIIIPSPIIPTPIDISNMKPYDPNDDAKTTVKECNPPLIQIINEENEVEYVPKHEYDNKKDGHISDLYSEVFQLIKNNDNVNRILEQLVEEDEETDDEFEDEEDVEEMDITDIENNVEPDIKTEDKIVQTDEINFYDEYEILEE